MLYISSRVLYTIASFFQIQAPAHKLPTLIIEAKSCALHSITSHAAVAWSVNYMVGVSIANVYPHQLPMMHVMNVRTFCGLPAKGAVCLYVSCGRPIESWLITSE